MDKLGKISENKSKPKRRWKSFKETSFKNRTLKAEKIFEKIKKQGLTTKDLIRLLSRTNNFLGVFASDQIPLISDSLYPVFLIINLDNSSLPGSHWILLRIESSVLEIYDSLGFDPIRWKKFPKSVIDFLLRYRYTHKFLGTPKLQDEKSFTCGAYCIYFILARQKKSFFQSLQIFSRNYCQNDQLVLEKIKKLLYVYFFC